MSHTLGAPVGPFRDSHDKNIFNSHCLFTLKNLFYVSDFLAYLLYLRQCLLHINEK